MVQVIPREPGLGELLGMGASQTTSAMLNAKINELVKQEHMKSLGNMLGLFSQQTPEPQSQVGENIAQPQVQGESISPQFSAQQKLAAALMGEKGLVDAMESIEKQGLERQKFALQKQKQEGDIPKGTQKRVSNTLNRYEELLKTGDIGLGAPLSVLSAKGRKNRGEFAGLGMSIESALMPLVNKGTLAKERFKFILSFIPNQWDTEATAQGKIKALRRELLNIEEPENTNVTNQEMAEQKIMFEKFPSASEIPSGKKIRDNETGKIYESNGVSWKEVKQ